MGRYWSTLIGAVLLLGYFSANGSAALPRFAKYVDDISLVVAPSEQEANSPGKIWYMLFVKPMPAPPECDATVSVTCTGGPESATVTVYRTSLQEWKSGEEGAVPFVLPPKPGLYEYVATLSITDPDDPANVWTMRSRPETVSVYAVLERTTVTLGPAGGVLTSPKFADAPRVTFARKALSAEAQVTLEVLSDCPYPVLDPKWTFLGRPARVHVKGASLEKSGRIEVLVPAPPPPAHPYRACPGIHGGATEEVRNIRKYKDGGYTWRLKRLDWHGDAPTDSDTDDWSFDLFFYLVDERPSESRPAASDQAEAASPAQ